MTNQETNVTNAFETTLSSGLSAGATTINVSSTTGAPAVPFYAVLDPANDSKREVVLVDSGTTATTLTLTAASKRGLDGTSDVAHDSGATVAVVPVAALWADINDRVEGHTHTGGTDGTAIATGDLTGHDKAAHDALNIDAATLDGLDSTDLVAVADHTKADHDALSLDHGSLSGLGDFETDHGTGHDTVHAKAQATRTTNTSPTTSAATVDFETEVLDPGGNFDLATDTYTAPEDGAYVVSGYALKASGDETVSLRAYVNGVDTAAVAQVGDGATDSARGAASLFLNSSDTVTVRYFRDGLGSGATVDTVKVEIVRI